MILEATEPSDNAFAIYQNDAGENFSCPSQEAINKKTYELYIRLGEEWVKLYPLDEKVMSREELTKGEYDALVTSSDFNPNTLYWITDEDNMAYLNRKNILDGGGGVIDVESLPTDPADIDVRCLYRLTITTAEPDQKDIKYYKVGKVGAVVSATGIKDGAADEVLWSQIATDINAYITSFEMTVTSETDTSTQAVVFYTESGSQKAGQKIGFIPTFTDVISYEIYFYSVDKDEWILIYPSAVEYEDMDIDFNDTSEWYPERA